MKVQHLSQRSIGCFRGWSDRQDLVSSLWIQGKQCCTVFPTVARQQDQNTIHTKSQAPCYFACRSAVSCSHRCNYVCTVLWLQLPRNNQDKFSSRSFQTAVHFIDCARLGSIISVMTTFLRYPTSVFVHPDSWNHLVLRKPILLPGVLQKTCVHLILGRRSHKHKHGRGNKCLTSRVTKKLSFIFHSWKCDVGV